MAKAARKSVDGGATGAAKKSAPRARRHVSPLVRESPLAPTPSGILSRSPSPPTRRSHSPIHPDILKYNAGQSSGDKRICDTLAKAIDRHLAGAESKIWHAHPVWFLEGNPIVGYHKLKDCVRLLFWSGRSFDEPGLAPEGGFKTAGARYTAEDQISASDLKRWLAKSAEIQWDYRNIVKRKGRLERLK